MSSNPESPSVPAIEIRGLQFAYGSQKLLFENLSWTVRQKDFWVVIGANGSGKSTLIRILLGLEKFSAGEVEIFGVPLTHSRRPWDSKPVVGYVPQHLNFDSQLPISVSEVVWGGMMRGFWKDRPSRNHPKKKRSQIAEALQEVNLEEAIDKPFATLSAGQRQRVLIARALATNARLLFFDEPTATVDPHSVTKIIQICQQISYKRTVVFVTHELSMIPQLCEQVLCLGAGRAHTHQFQNMSPENLYRLLEHSIKS